MLMKGTFDNYVQWPFEIFFELETHVNTCNFTIGKCNVFIDFERKISIHSRL